MTNAEIQVGEYVRTKEHGIFKVTELHEAVGKYCILNNDKYETYTIGGGAPRFDISKDIAKHSFNIIDLIKEGDYVNGDRVELSRDGELYVAYSYLGGIGVRTLESYYTYVEDMKEKDIETIVTKEQFKSMEYKAGEEDD